MSASSIKFCVKITSQISIVCLDQMPGHSVCHFLDTRLLRLNQVKIEREQFSSNKNDTINQEVINASDKTTVIL